MNLRRGGATFLSALTAPVVGRARDEIRPWNTGRGGGIAAARAEVGEKYELVSSLGTGAGGETFEADDRRDGAHVGVKRLVYGRAAYYRAIAVERHDAAALKAARADLQNAKRANANDKWAAMALAELDALDVTKK